MQANHCNLNNWNALKQLKILDQAKKYVLYTDEKHLIQSEDTSMPSVTDHSSTYRIGEVDQQWKSQKCGRRNGKNVEWEQSF